MTPFQFSRAAAATVLGSLGILGWGAAIAEEAPEPQKLALLVGINKYLETDITPDLEGPEADVEEMAQLLEVQFGFSPDPQTGIRKLVGEAATNQGIIQAFEEHLIGKAQPGAVVVFFFSGHGGQIEDRTGDETYDQRDETLVVYDSGRTDGTAFDIRDDQINGLIRRLRAKEPGHVAVIIDSCHSGSATRNGFARSRLAEGKVDKRPYEPSSDELGDRQDAGGHGTFAGDDYVTLSACQAGQLSYEFFSPDGTWRGVFTHHFVQAVRDHPKPVLTYGEVLQAVQARMQSGAANQSARLQSPGGEGDLSSSLFGGLRKNPLPRYYTVGEYQDPRENAEGKRPEPILILDGGAAHGLSAGSVFAVYPPGTEVFPRNQDVPRVVLERVEATQSTFRVEGEPKEKLEPDSRAVEVEHAYPMGRIPVFIGSPTQDGAGNPLEPLLAFVGTGKTFVRVDDPEQALLRFEATEDDRVRALDFHGNPLPVYQGPRAFLLEARNSLAPGPLDQVPVLGAWLARPVSLYLDEDHPGDEELLKEVRAEIGSQGSSFRIVSRREDADLVVTSPPGGGVQAFDREETTPATHLHKRPERLLEHWAKWQNLFQLENQNREAATALGLSLRVERVTGTEKKAASGTGEKPPAGEAGTEKAVTEEVVKVQDGRLVRSQGGSEVFHPGDHLDVVVRNDGKEPFSFALFDLSPDGAVRLLDVSETEQLQPGAEVRAELEALPLPTKEPVVVDCLKVIATARPLPLRELEMEQVRVAGLPVTRSGFSEALEDPLFRLLRSAALQDGEVLGTRSIPVDQKWATATLSLRREERPAPPATGVSSAAPPNGPAQPESPPP